MLQLTVLLAPHTHTRDSHLLACWHAWHCTAHHRQGLTHSVQAEVTEPEPHDTPLVCSLTCIRANQSDGEPVLNMLLLMRTHDTSLVPHTLHSCKSTGLTMAR